MSSSDPDSAKTRKLSENGHQERIFALRRDCKGRNGRKPTEIHKLPPGRLSFHTAWTLSGHSAGRVKSRPPPAPRTLQNTGGLCLAACTQRYHGRGVM